MLDRNKGFHANRYKREPLEKLFAEHWDKINRDQPNWGATLPLILSGDQKHTVFLRNRDWKLAATVIQWLGSTCGQIFIKEVLEQYGKDTQHAKKRTTNK